MEAMKLVIPPECQLGAIKFAIRRNDLLLERLNKSADISSADQVIRIAHREASSEFLGLVHEACHGICDELGLTDGEQGENFIKGLSTGITLFLVSLGIEPDFSQIPEE